MRLLPNTIMGLDVVKHSNLSNDVVYELMLERANAIEKSGDIQAAEVAFFERAYLKHSPLGWLQDSEDEKIHFGRRFPILEFS